MKKKIMIEIEWENAEYSLRVKTNDEVRPTDLNVIVGVLNQLRHSYLETIIKRTQAIKFEKLDS